MSKGIFQIENSVPLAISAGLINGVSHFAQFGYNDNLANGTEAVVWQGPTALYVFPSDTGEAMELVSDNIADTQTVLVQALDADWNQINLQITLNGTTPVTTGINLARVNRLINIDTTETIGEVTLQGAGGGTVYAVMEATDQISTQVIFSVPLGFNAKLESSLVTLNKSGGSDSGVIIRFKRRAFGGVFGLGARFGLNKQGTTATTIEVSGVTPLTAKSDVMLLALADANGTDVSARLPFTLYKV